MTSHRPRTPVIEADGVTYAYKHHPVIEGISLTIDHGEYVGLIGPNGSGKTTLLKLLLGLLTPDEGSVRLFGTTAHKYPDGERLGYVSQQSTELGTSMPVTVREVVKMGRYAHRGLRRLTDHDHDIVDDALTRVGISHLENRRVGRLSGGQQQRVFIGRALASEADLLALDEPTVGVDAESREQFYGLLDELNGRGITIILIEHDIGIVRDHVDSVICINQRLLHQGPPEIILNEQTLAQVYETPDWAISSV